MDDVYINVPFNTTYAMASMSYENQAPTRYVAVNTYFYIENANTIGMLVTVRFTTTQT